MRSRTFDWEEPTAIWHRAEGKSGLELLRMAVDGEFPPPPMARLMDTRLIEVEHGQAVFVGTPQEFHYNPIGSVHGGFGATLLDSAMGCAVAPSPASWRWSRRPAPRSHAASTPTTLATPAT